MLDNFLVSAFFSNKTSSVSKSITIAAFLAKIFDEKPLILKNYLK